MLTNPSIDDDLDETVDPIDMYLSSLPAAIWYSFVHHSYATH